MLQKKSVVELKKVVKGDWPFLYELLSQRDSRVNISHKTMPSYVKHIKFVMSKPYSKWYVIHYGCQRVGSIYLTKQNEIGIFIKKEIQGKGVGKQALKLLMKYNPRSRYLANINPKNTKSIDFFRGNGFNLIQCTYELTVPKMK